MVGLVPHHTPEPEYYFDPNAFFGFFIILGIVGVAIWLYVRHRREIAAQPPPIALPPIVWTKVMVSAQTLSMPPLCSCCGAEAQVHMPVSSFRQTGVRVIHTQVHTWQFPYCGTCAGHANAWPRLQNSGCLEFVLIMATAGLFLFVLAARRREHQEAEQRSIRMCSSSCATPALAVVFAGWQGPAKTFHFASEPFALAFMAANASKLLNLDYGVAERLKVFMGQTASRGRRAQEHRPADPQFHGNSSDDSLYQETIRQLERERGPSTRKAVLHAALSRMQQQHMRERLMLEASKIDVSAVLDKVDGLKTIDAKRRNLKAALDELRADPIPDHLQAPQIAALEAALANLGAGQ